LAKPRDARARRTAQALQSALLSLLAEKPMEQVTVRDIADRAGINYATFFRHHPGKEALLEYVAADEIRRLVELTLPVLDSHNMAAANRAVFAHVQENRSLWKALLTGGAGSIMREEQLRLSRAVAAERNLVERDIPLVLAVNCTASLIFETLVWWLDLPEGEFSPDQAADILTSLQVNHDLLLTEKR